MLEASIILTPVDSIPICSSARSSTNFLHGLYATDKQRSKPEQRQARILFAGRDRITRDIRQIHRDFATQLGGAQASLRMLSGLHAHTVVFMSLANIGDSVLLIPEHAGGHFATGAILSRLGLRVIEAISDDTRQMIDRERTLDLIRREQPSFVFVDRSEGLKYEDFSFLGSLTTPITIFDSSHYLAQILNRQYTNPFDWGFDFQLFTLHKSFPGPQKAGIVARRQNEVSDRCFHGLGSYISSSHVENTYLAGLALTQTDVLRLYADRLLSTTIELEAALASRSLPVVRRSHVGERSWPATQHIWMRFPDQMSAFAAWSRLARARIITNYRLLPYGLGWGLRLGVTAAVVQGLTSDHVGQLAMLIEQALCPGAIMDIRHRVRAFAISLATSALDGWTVT